jgi:hypothetical protein
MRLDLEDSVLKRAWVLKLWDAKTRKACKELVEREDFHEPTFYLADGIYAVSGKNPATDPNRWLRIQNNKGEWCKRRDIPQLVPAASGKVKGTSETEKASEYREYTLHICYRCDETFVSPDGTEPYRDLVDWEEDKPIYEQFCESCAEAREWNRANHYHYCSYCENVLRLVEQPRGAHCHLCQMMMNPSDVKDWSELTCHSCTENKSNHTEDEYSS